MNLSTNDYIHNYFKSKNYYNLDIFKKLNVIMKNWCDSRKRSRLNKYWLSFIKDGRVAMFERVVNWQYNLKS